MNHEVLEAILGSYLKILEEVKEIRKELKEINGCRQNNTGLNNTISNEGINKNKDILNKKPNAILKKEQLKRMDGLSGNINKISPNTMATELRDNPKTNQNSDESEKFNSKTNNSFFDLQREELLRNKIDEKIKTGVKKIMKEQKSMENNIHINNVSNTQSKAPNDLNNSFIDQFMTPPCSDIEENNLQKFLTKKKMSNIVSLKHEKETGKLSISQNYCYPFYISQENIVVPEDLAANKLSKRKFLSKPAPNPANNCPNNYFISSTQPVKRNSNLVTSSTQKDTKFMFSSTQKPKIYRASSAREEKSIESHSITDKHSADPFFKMLQKEIEEEL